MTFRRDPDAGRSAATWLAVSFILTSGVGVCSFIILAFADDPRQGFTVLGVIVAGTIIMLWGMSHPRDKTAARSWLSFWRKTQEQPDPAETYTPRRRRRSRGPVGTNEPPTLESVREIAETHARWVPHGSAPRRDRPER